MDIIEQLSQPLLSQSLPQQQSSEAGWQGLAAELSKLSFNDFNVRIGLPKHPETNQPMKLMPYQTGFFETLNQRRYKKFHVNKARQIGWTELMRRILLYGVLHWYAGGEIIIIAGTRKDTVKIIMDKLRELVHYSDLMQLVENETDYMVKFKNGTRITGLPSNSEAIRGLSYVRAVFVDEAAHFDLVDDSEVLNAINPIVETNASDLFLISTPNGPRGFYYQVEKEGEDYFKIKQDIWTVKGLLYSEDRIKQWLAKTDIDTDQEYLNQYTSGRNAIFPPPKEQKYEAETF